MGERLTIGLEARGASVRVVTAGVLDEETARALAGYLQTVASTYQSAIELDLRAVTAIDPAGVRVLLELRRQFRRRLRIVPSRAIARTVHFVARSERNRRSTTGPGDAHEARA